MKLNLNKVENLSKLYNDEKILSELKEIKGDVEIIHDDNHVYLPDELAKAISFRENHAEVRIVSGATDLGVVANKGKLKLNKVLSLNNIDSAYEVTESDKGFEIGAKVSLDLCEKKLEKDFPEFSSMLHIFASPQIKNIGTLIGNLVNASPIADSIPFLMVADVDINLIGPKGERSISINKFFKGNYKELDLATDEMVKSVFISKSDHAYKLYKVSIRRDLDISSVTFAARYKMNEGSITELNLAYGGVGPIVLRMPILENDLMSGKFDSKLVKAAVDKIPSLLTPLSDHRGSKEFRTQICQNLLFRFFDEVSGSVEASV
jgi:xanthine dehydrogenase small subunit